MACPTGKRQHATYEEALAHQKELIWTNIRTGDTERSKGLNVYRCPIPTCGAWHVGHREQTTIPLVYHYTIAKYLDVILEAGELRPRDPRKASWAVNEPNPFLWFSWNPKWEHSCIKDHRRPSERHNPPTGRAVTELWGGGLIRWGAPASVAKLRWNDYLARNYTPLVQRDGMAQRGNPVDWLGTDQPVPLSECKVYEAWFQGQWVPWETLDPDEFDAYLENREAVYAAAWKRLHTKIMGDEWLAACLPTFDDDAERILFEDIEVEIREDHYRDEHLPELQRLTRTLAKQFTRQTRWRHGGKRRSKRKGKRKR